MSEIMSDYKKLIISIDTNGVNRITLNDIPRTMLYPKA